MRNADYVSAIKHIKACLGSPTQHPSQIHIEAYKVFSILRILQRNAIHLSEYTADCVIRVTRKECLVYVQLVEAFNQSISSYTQFLDKNRVILKKDNHLNLLKGKGLEACWLNSLLNQGKCVSRANLEFVCREMTGNHRVNDLNDLELLIKKSDGVEIDEETKIVVFEGKYVCKNLEISVEETELIRSEMFARLNEVNML